MNNIAIVIPCYRRVDSLKSLFNSLLEANYGGDSVSLIFAIDFSGSRDVANFVSDLEWPYGAIRIIEHPQNIGLRNNILFCGDLTKEYEAVIVIEDDLEVAQSFYLFAKQAAEFYANDDKIGGISIYNYYKDEMSWNPFIPISEGYDVTFIRWASSWGQLWTKSQWTKFRKWLESHEDLGGINIPLRVKNWKGSWKKYYIAYLTDTDRYFVFPTQSYILNANKAGGEHTFQHKMVLTSSPFNYYNQTTFRFIPFNESLYRYDAFFQLILPEIEIKGKKYEIELDLFGFKEHFEKEYVITSRPCKKEDIVYSFDHAMIPFELNIITDRPGKFFHLVKSSCVCEKKEKQASLAIVPDTIWRDDINRGIHKLFKSIKGKL